MKDNLKWLLLIPVLAIAIAAGFLIPKWLSDESGGEAETVAAENPALEIEVSNKQEQAEQFQTLIDKNPQDTVALKGLGNTYLEMGSIQKDGGQLNEAYRSFKSAIDSYRSYLQLVPDDYEVRIDLGFSYYNMLMFDVAEKQLSSVTAEAPENQRAWLVYGVVLDRMVRTDEARAAWQRAYDLGPNTDVGQEAKSFLEQN